MLQKLVWFSIRFPGIIIALAGVMLAYGAYISANAKLDVFPEFAPPRVVVLTSASGFSPEQVETMVTRPVENAISGVGNLESLRSESISGLSAITAIFKDGTDVTKARQQLAERLNDVAGNLPAGVKPPAMEPLTSSTSTVLHVGLTTEARSPLELRDFADGQLTPRLLAVPGVAKVAVFGGEGRQLQAIVDSAKLQAADLTMDDVLKAVKNATGVKGLGFIETEAQRIVLQSDYQLLTPEDLSQLVILRKGGNTVVLGDLARLEYNSESKNGDANVGNRAGIVLVVSSQFGANTLEVTRDVEKALTDLAPDFAAQQITVQPGLFRPANFIETAVSNVRASLLIGSVLVAAVLFAFLVNARTAAISLTAIPLSLLGAVIVLDRLGVSLNTLTLGGLAIAIGEVVDDAIIDVENISRRLRENAAAGHPRSAFRVVLDASLEVRNAVVYASFIVALVFMPVLAMSGLQGRLFAPLAIAYILAILTSLVVALTVTPALSLVLLPKAGRLTEPRHVTAIKSRYQWLLRTVTAHPGRVMTGAGLLCLGAAATIPLMGGEFLPEFREGHFIVHMYTVPGTSLKESMRLGKLVSQELLKVPNVRSVSQQAGRASGSDDTAGPHYSEFDVDFVPMNGNEQEATEGRVRQVLAQFPGALFSMNSFLAERIDETVSGTNAQLAVNVYGSDLDVLDQKAEEVAKVVSRIPGATDVHVQSSGGVPQASIHLRPEALRKYGLQPALAMNEIQIAIKGTDGGQVAGPNGVFDISVIMDESVRRSPEMLGSVLVRTPDSGRVALRDLADITFSSGRYSVMHDGGRRRQVVTANVQERDLSAFVAEAKQAIASQVQLPAGTYVTFGGASEARAKAQSELFFDSALAAVGIILLLGIVFGSARTLLIVLANLPFALVGGVLAVFANGGWLSVGSLVGFVTVFGITTRNTIMLVSHYKRLVTVEGRPWNRETAVRGASERFVPIVMTALVSGLGLLPIALGNGDPGKEIEGPMATVILGGLASATLLTLFVLPTIALRFGRFSQRKEHEADNLIESDGMDGIHVVEGDGVDGIRALRMRMAEIAALHQDDHEHRTAHTGTHNGAQDSGSQSALVEVQRD